MFVELNTTLMHQLSSDYNNLYKQNIQKFQKNYHQFNESQAWYTHFYPSIGNPKADILVYGQALNGWDCWFGTQQDITDKQVMESIDFSNTGLPSKGLNGLDWVNVCWSNSVYNDYIQDTDIKKFYEKITYRTCRSFFWNVVYKVVCDYYSIEREKKDWTEHVIWSNLYKIAPDGSNPNHQERGYQLQLSAELVRQEIEETNPKYCIVITNGEWWHPFAQHLHTEKLIQENIFPEIISVEKYRGTKIIVTKRPRFGNSDLYAKLIKDLMQ